MGANYYFKFNLLHVIFYMPVFGIVPEIVEDEKLEEEKTNNQNNRGNHNILANVDIVDPMNTTCHDDTYPKPFNTFHTGISLPPECFLSQ